MHQLLDKYLCDKYPKIFADRYKPMTETCMCWGLDVGNGWYSLLDNLCHNIQQHIDNPQWIYNEKIKEYEEPPEGTTACPQVVAQQVKQKFSGLRFYYSGGDEYIHGLVDNAESLSYFICEECGVMDESVGRNKVGWIVTSCREHARNKENFNTNGGKDLEKIWRKVRQDEEEKRKKIKEDWRQSDMFGLLFGEPPK